jgi:hypothetical protein
MLQNTMPHDIVQHKTLKLAAKSKSTVTVTVTVSVKKSAPTRTCVSAYQDGYPSANLVGQVTHSHCGDTCRGVRAHIWSFLHDGLAEEFYQVVVFPNKLT